MTSWLVVVVEVGVAAVEVVVVDLVDRGGDGGSDGRPRMTGDDGDAVVGVGVVDEGVFRFLV